MDSNRINVLLLLQTHVRLSQKSPVSDDQLTDYCNQAAEIALTRVIQPINDHRFPQSRRRRVIAFLLPLEPALFGPDHVTHLTIVPRPGHRPCYRSRDVQRINTYLTIQAMYLEAEYPNDPAYLPEDDTDHHGGGGGGNDRRPSTSYQGRDQRGTSTFSRSSSRGAAGTSFWDEDQRGSAGGSQQKHKGRENVDRDRESRAKRSEETDRRDQTTRGQPSGSGKGQVERQDGSRDHQARRSAQSLADQPQPKIATPPRHNDRKRSPSRSKGSKTAVSPQPKERKQSHSSQSSERRTHNPSPPRSSRSREPKKPSPSSKPGEGTDRRSPSRRRGESGKGQREEKKDGSSRKGERGKTVMGPPRRDSGSTSKSGEAIHENKGSAKSTDPKGQSKKTPSRRTSKPPSENLELDSSGADMMIVDEVDTTAPPGPHYQYGSILLTNNPQPPLQTPPQSPPTSSFGTEFDRLLKEAAERTSSGSGDEPKFRILRKSFPSESDQEIRDARRRVTDTLVSHNEVV